jgi:hypothetical protein
VLSLLFAGPPPKDEVKSTVKSSFVQAKQNDDLSISNKKMKCLENLLTSNVLRDTLCSESYKRGGENAGILREVQKEG